MSRPDIIADVKGYASSYNPLLSFENADSAIFDNLLPVMYDHRSHAIVMLHTSRLAVSRAAGTPVPRS